MKYVFIVITGLWGDSISISKVFASKKQALDYIKLTFPEYFRIRDSLYAENKFPSDFTKYVQIKKLEVQHETQN